MTDEQVPVGAVVRVKHLRGNSLSAKWGLREGMVGIVSENTGMGVAAQFITARSRRRNGEFWFLQSSLERIDTQHTTEE